MEPIDKWIEVSPGEYFISIDPAFKKIDYSWQFTFKMPNLDLESVEEEIPTFNEPRLKEIKP